MSRFLDAHDIDVDETVPASQKLGRSEAASLIKGASEVWVAKGKKLEHFKGGRASADLIARMLGPTGNLRSPTLRIGKTVVVGFNAETLERVLG